jgi:hypothetical protein
LVIGVVLLANYGVKGSHVNGSFVLDGAQSLLRSGHDFPFADPLLVPVVKADGPFPSFAMYRQLEGARLNVTHDVQVTGTNGSIVQHVVVNNGQLVVNVVDPTDGEWSMSLQEVPVLGIPAETEAQVVDCSSGIGRRTDGPCALNVTQDQDVLVRIEFVAKHSDGVLNMSVTTMELVAPGEPPLVSCSTAHSCAREHSVHKPYYIMWSSGGLAGENATRIFYSARSSLYHIQGGVIFLGIGVVVALVALLVRRLAKGQDAEYVAV